MADDSVNISIGFSMMNVNQEIINWLNSE